MGAYLGLTGNRANVSDALGIGLIDYHIPSERIPKLVDRLLSDSSEFAMHKPSEFVHSMCESFKTPTDEAPIAQHRQSIACCFGHDEISAIMHALSKNQDDWAKSTLLALARKSPMSLSVTLKALGFAKALNFDENMQMEYRLVNRFLQGHDFMEGVRALLIDKDKSPQWRPVDLDSINPADVEHYFHALETQELEF